MQCTLRMWSGFANLRFWRELHLREIVRTQLLLEGLCCRILELLHDDKEAAAHPMDLEKEQQDQGVALMIVFKGVFTTTFDDYISHHRGGYHRRMHCVRVQGRTLCFLSLTWRDHTGHCEYSSESRNTPLVTVSPSMYPPSSGPKSATTSPYFISFESAMMCSSWIKPLGFYQWCIPSLS